MKLELENFRKHDKLSVTFSPFTLLKGSSGQGKSTLFAAFNWCLYGTLKCVYPFGNSTAKTLVRVCFSNLQICRTRNPKTLSLQVENSSYKDGEAQAIIEQVFGEKSLWLATSFLEQGANHILLRSGNADCVSILDTLAFSSEKPREFISNINSEYKRIEGATLVQRKRLEDLHAELEPLLANFSQEELCEEESIPKLRSLLEEEKKKLALATKEALREEHALGKKLHLEKERERITCDLQKLPQKLEKRKNITCLREERDKSLHYFRTKLEWEKLTCQINELSANLTEIDSVDAASLLRDGQEYEKNLSLCQKLGLSYSEKEVATFLQQLEEKVKVAQEEAILYQEYEKRRKVREKFLLELATLERRINSLPLDKVEEEEIETLRKRLDALQLQSKILFCPKCGEACRLEGRNKLVSEENIVEREEESKEDLLHKLNQAEKRKENAKLLVELNYKRETLLKHLSDVKEERPLPPPPSQLEEWRRQISSLSRVCFLTKPKYEREELQRISQIQRLKQKLPVLPEKQRKVEEIELEIEEEESRAKVEDKREKLEKELVRVEKELLQIKIIGWQEKLAHVQEQVKNLEKKVANAEIYAKYKEYQSLEGQYEEGLADLLALERLRQHSIKAEMQNLQYVVDSCNYVLEKVCSAIFEEPIRARLRLTKKLKNGNEVHKVNFSISYRGVEGEVDQLSGGEKQRISIALTLALSQFSPAPLLLDECLAYLDADLQELCIEAIKTFSEDKTVVYVGHNMTEGYFDDVISL